MDNTQPVNHEGTEAQRSVSHRAFWEAVIKALLFTSPTLTTRTAAESLSPGIGTDFMGAATDLVNARTAYADLSVGLRQAEAMALQPYCDASKSTCNSADTLFTFFP